MLRKSHRNPALVPLKCTLPQHNWTILATVSSSFLAGNSREASIHIHYSCLCLCGPLRVWWWLIFHALLFVGQLLRCDPASHAKESTSSRGKIDTRTTHIFLMTCCVVTLVGKFVTSKVFSSAYLAAFGHTFLGGLINSCVPEHQPGIFHGSMTSSTK